jgi:hypothetical protein
MDIKSSGDHSVLFDSVMPRLDFTKLEVFQVSITNEVGRFR